MGFASVNSPWECSRIHFGLRSGCPTQHAALASGGTASGPHTHHQCFWTPPPPTRPVNACPPQDEFLASVQQLAPDLCVTAAYGNILPQRFLDIPPLGTLNIHPSLLPK